MAGGLATVGEATGWWLLKVGVLVAGDAACEGGVGRVLGDAAEVWVGGGREVMPGSILGAMLEPDRREWCLFKIARWIGGGCTMF